MIVHSFITRVKCFTFEKSRQKICFLKCVLYFLKYSTRKFNNKYNLDINEHLIYCCKQMHRPWSLPGMGYSQALANANHFQNM